MIECRRDYYFIRVCQQPRGTRVTRGRMTHINVAWLGLYDFIITSFLPFDDLGVPLRTSPLSTRVQDVQLIISDCTLSEVSSNKRFTE